MLTLILGGAKSGKSRLAQNMAEPSNRVCYVATAIRDGDPEMTARIDRHRASRPAHWQTVEEPFTLDSAVEETAPETDAVIVDCLTVWLSNLLWRFREDTPERVEEEVRRQLTRITAAAGCAHIILVSNEVGAGIVPESRVARLFRDLQGLVNQWAAESADEVILAIAGLPLYLKPAPAQKARA